MKRYGNDRPLKSNLDTMSSSQAWKYTINVYCVATTVCTMPNQWCIPYMYHCETHKLTRRDVMQTIIQRKVCIYQKPEFEGHKIQWSKKKDNKQGIHHWFGMVQTVVATQYTFIVYFHACELDIVSRFDFNGLGLWCLTPFSPIFQLKIEQYEQTKNGNGGVSGFCSTSGTCRVTDQRHKHNVIWRSCLTLVCVYQCR
jgi:hypothetical protein